MSHNLKISDAPMVDCKPSYKESVSNKLLTINSPPNWPPLEKDDNLLENDLINLSIDKKIVMTNLGNPR